MDNAELAVAITNLRTALRDATEALERIDALTKYRFAEPTPAEWKPFINQRARVVREPHFTIHTDTLMRTAGLEIGDEVTITLGLDSDGDVGVRTKHSPPGDYPVRLADLEPLP